MLVFLDTSPLIYLLDFEDVRVVRQIDQWVRSGYKFATSYVTLAELLIHPKKQHDLRKEGQYRLYLEQLITYPMISVDARVANFVAEIRADYGFKLPDAMQLAAAISVGADVFYTNDANLTKCKDLEVVLVSE